MLSSTLPYVQLNSDSLFFFMFFLSKASIWLELILWARCDFHSVSHPVGGEEKSQRDMFLPFGYMKEGIYCLMKKIWWSLGLLDSDSNQDS